MNKHSYFILEKFYGYELNWGLEPKIMLGCKQMIVLIP